MLDKIYLEITNVCNLDCSFCHKTSRTKKLMTKEEFDIILDKIAGKSRCLYFHLMGEPTLHPQLPEFIKLSKDKDFLPCLTTNGSLLSKCKEDLLSNPPYKINISLHAPDANPTFASDNYLATCVDFAKEIAKKGTFVALRLWNLGSGTDNTKILDFLHNEFPNEWRDVRGGKSQRLDTRIFLEWGEQFDWPDTSLPECDKNADMFCYGLRDQIGILADGTVVPCCLDADANLSLGNIFNSTFDEIISAPRAKAIYDGFTNRRAVESLCRKCGYAKRFSKK